MRRSGGGLSTPGGGSRRGRIDRLRRGPLHVGGEEGDILCDLAVGSPRVDGVVGALTVHVHQANVAGETLLIRESVRHVIDGVDIHLLADDDSDLVGAILQPTVLDVRGCRLARLGNRGENPAFATKPGRILIAWRRNGTWNSTSQCSAARAAGRRCCCPPSTAEPRTPGSSRTMTSTWSRRTPGRGIACCRTTTGCAAPPSCPPATASRRPPTPSR